MDDADKLEALGRVAKADELRAKSMELVASQYKSEASGEMGKC